MRQNRREAGQRAGSGFMGSPHRRDHEPVPSTRQGLSASTAATPRCRKNHDLWEVPGPLPTNSHPPGTSQRDRMPK